MEQIILRQSAIVDCDFEAIEKRLNEQLDIYRNMVFTEESKKDAKDTVAQLRKEKDAFSNRVKEIKKEYMKPFDEFFTRANELVKMYDGPIDFINEQITAFEEQRIKAKKETIRFIYAEMVPEEEWQVVIPLDRIYNKKWENATFKEKDIKDEIMVRKLEAKSAIDAIKGFGSEKESFAIDMYSHSYNLTECIVYLTNYEKQKAEIVAKEKEKILQAEELRIRAEERAKIENEAKIAQAKEEAVAALIPDDNGAEVSSYAYTIKLTDDAKSKLEMYMDSVGIEFECLPIQEAV